VHNETLQVDCATENGIVVVRLVGELDMSNAEYVEQAAIGTLSGLESDGSRVIVDVSELTFCDSGGLRALLAIGAKAASAGHPVTLRKPSKMLRRMLELTDLRQLFAFDE
jgi:anti-sigma B factor antagonist